MPDSTQEAQNTPFRPFNPFRQPRTASLQDFIKQVVREVEEHERSLGQRVRKRRADDEVRFQGIVCALICDLIHRLLGSPNGRLSVSMQTGAAAKSRYQPAQMGKQFPKVVKALTEIGYIDLHLGRMPSDGKPSITTISPSPKLIQVARDLGVTRKDISTTKEAEIIILREKKSGRNHKPSKIDYDDTEHTHKLRKQLTAINDFLEKADITLATPYDVNIAARQLRRTFIANFYQGGRAGGGFWMGMKKEQRRSILINSEPTISLDYSEAAIRILYSLAKVPLPQAGVYNVPGLEGCRDGIKALLNAMTWKNDPFTRYPSGTRDKFPKDMSVHKASQLILNYHKAVSHLLMTEIGMRIQYIESCIMASVVQSLMEMNIVALPVHDAFVVQERHEAIAMDVMASTFKSFTGIEAGVKKE